MTHTHRLTHTSTERKIAHLKRNFARRRTTRKNFTNRWNDSCKTLPVFNAILLSGKKPCLRQEIRRTRNSNKQTRNSTKTLSIYNWWGFFRLVFFVKVTLEQREITDQIHYMFVWPNFEMIGDFLRSVIHFVVFFSHVCSFYSSSFFFAQLYSAPVWNWRNLYSFA